MKALTKSSLITILMLSISNLFGQTYSIPENLKIGLFARPAIDFYKFYNGKSKNDGLYTVRNTPGYNAGILIQSKIYSVFEGYFGFGFGETTYKPDYQYDTERLARVGLRAFQFNLGGELRTAQSGKVIPAITVGLQAIAIREKSEIAFPVATEKYAWPNLRIMPQVGLNYHIRLNKKMELITGAGLRILWNRNLGWEYTFNQVFANIGVVYQVKEW